MGTLGTIPGKPPVDHDVDVVALFVEKLTELGWPHRVKVAPEVFYPLGEACNAKLQSLAGDGGVSTLSFQFEITQVVLNTPVTRPDEVDLSDFTFSPVTEEAPAPEAAPDPNAGNAPTIQ